MFSRKFALAAGGAED